MAPRNARSARPRRAARLAVAGLDTAAPDQPLAQQRLRGCSAPLPVPAPPVAVPAVQQIASGSEEISGTAAQNQLPRPGELWNTALDCPRTSGLQTCDPGQACTIARDAHVEIGRASCRERV